MVYEMLRVWSMGLSLPVLKLLEKPSPPDEERVQSLLGSRELGIIDDYSSCLQRHER